MAIQLLAGKRGVIFGALDDQSLAWKIADVCHQMGATFTLTNAPVALRMGALQTLAEGIGAQVIPADATSVADLEHLFQKSEEILGGIIDFVLHAIGMSVNLRKKKSYTDLNHDWMQKTFDISAISFHKMCQVLYKGDHMAEWGSIVGLTYIAAQRVFPDYGEMAESKSLLESFARSFGYHFGEKSHVRVNTFSQSPTMTTAGKGIPGFTEFFGYGDDMSPLGNAPAEDCANYCATLFSDLTRYVTMQNLFHDGGFSNMGMNPKLIRTE
jgi:enoyl-[acyl-carrier protein] reductase I